MKADTAHLCHIIWPSLWFVIYREWRNYRGLSTVPKDHLEIYARLVFEIIHE